MIAFVSSRDLSGMLPIWRSCRRAGKKGSKATKYSPSNICADVSEMLCVKVFSDLYLNWPGVTTLIVFPHVLLSPRVQYILNVTREIDNFFPGVFEYHNIRVYDEEATDLLAYWNDTYKFISRAK